MNLCKNSRAELLAMGFVSLADQTELPLKNIVGLVGVGNVDALLSLDLPLPSPADDICNICGLEIEPVRPPRDTAELRSIGKTLAAIAEAVSGPHALYDILCSQTAETIADRDAGTSLVAVSASVSAAVSAAITAYNAESAWQQALREMFGNSSGSAEECDEPSNVLYFPGCTVPDNQGDNLDMGDALWEWLLDDSGGSDEELPF